MIVAFSTSSPLASVALIEQDGRILWEGNEDANHAASGACLLLLSRGLDAARLSLEEATLFAADLGPGSFTGVRVGVTLAKTFAYRSQVGCIGADAFDLVSLDQVVVMPSKRGEFFVRTPGQPAERASVAPQGSVGFGPGIADPVHPLASGFAKLIGKLEPRSPELLLPAYLIEPSISTPKKAFGVARG